MNLEFLSIKKVEVKQSSWFVEDTIWCELFQLENHIALRSVVINWG